MSKIVHIADNLSQMLKTLREDNEWTQTELASKLNISAMSIRRYENGQIGKSLDFGLIENLAKILAETPEGLLLRLMGGQPESAQDKSEGKFQRFIGTADAAALDHLDSALSPLPPNEVATELARLCQFYLLQDRLEQFEAIMEMSRKLLSSEHLDPDQREDVRDFLRNILGTYRKALSTAGG